MPHVDTAGVPPTALRLTGAILSAALASTAPASAEDFAKAIAKEGLHWNAGASEPSFQALEVRHGSTVATARSIAPDPWQELEALGENWDANGAQAVSRDAMEHAKRFLSSIATITAPFTPFAHPDGSIGLESQKRAGAAYLVVTSSNRFSYVLKIGETVHRGDDVDAEKMRELLALLY